jgi:hypothetical protein
MLTQYLDGLDALVDGRGFDGSHEKARLFVEGACETLSLLSRMDTPTDKAKSAEHADNIMANLSDDRLCGDAAAFYELIRKARALTE